MYFSGNTCIPEICLQKRFLKAYSFGNTAMQEITGSETKVSSWRCTSLRYLQHCPEQLDHLPSEKHVSNRRNRGCLWAKADAEQSHFKINREKKGEDSGQKKRKTKKKFGTALKKILVSSNHSFIQIMPKKMNHLDNRVQ